MATIVYWFHNTSVEIMSRKEEVNTIQGAGCAARTSHREIFFQTFLFWTNWQIYQALYRHYFLSCQWSLSSYHSLFSVATILGEGEELSESIEKSTLPGN